MTREEILTHVDHTILFPTATWRDVKWILDDAIKYNCASACIPPSFVKRAGEYVGDKLTICTVIGFPNGYNTTSSKVFETKDAIRKGAKEIDMVINIGMVKEGHYGVLLEEIKEVRKACEGYILKVIIETCQLTDDEIIRMCKLVHEAGADYIKTSTGFSTEGANIHVMRVLADNVPEGLKIKASGGIKTFDDAYVFLALGADRLGTSRLVKLMTTDDSSSSY